MELKTFDSHLTLTNGKYESLVKARKPAGIDDKSAYLIGTGIGALAAGCFLIRDAHMDGSKITFLEQLDLPGGSMDGRIRENMSYVARGGREMVHHFEVLWDLFSSLPSDEGLQDKTIEEVLAPNLLHSDYWTIWRTMFAFENWHSALEMKLYMNRFIHHVDGLPHLTALQFSRHDQYNRFIKQILKYLKNHGAKFRYGVTVNNVEFDIATDKKAAIMMVYRLPYNSVNQH